MSKAPARRRAGSTIWGWLVAVLIATLAPGSLSGQVPTDTVPADTARSDTLVVPIPAGTVDPDTLPADSLMQRDSVIRVPPFPRWPDRRPLGWGAARWEWNRDELLRYHGLSLLQLLERVPGLLATRTGDFGSPAAVSALGAGGGRLRVFIDGFEVAPLGFGTPDLQQLGLVDLESIRVERGLQGLRVDLATLRMPEDGRPVSIVEAGTGVYDTKLLRALLMRGVGGRSVLSGSFEQATSAGFGFVQPFSASGSQLRWSYALDSLSVLQLEYHGKGVESTTESWPLSASERTLLLRGRSALRPGLMVDGMIGRTTRRSGEGDPLTRALSSLHAAARAVYDAGPASVEGSARLRTGAGAVGLPTIELEARGLFQPAGWLAAESEVRSTARQGTAALEWSGTLRAGAARGLSAFGTLALGERALGVVRDSTEEGTETTPREGFPVFATTAAGSAGARAGAEWATDRANVGVAALALSAGEVAPFGYYGIDRGTEVVQVGDAQGVEAYASVPVPLLRDLLRIDGTYQRWMKRGGRPYLPTQTARASALLHGLFFDSELEPSLRVQVEHRGRALVPGPQGDAFDGESVPHTLTDLFLQIRIIDVRAFLVWHNLLDVRGTADLPGRPLPGGRFFYGVHWTFRN